MFLGGQHRTAPDPSGDNERKRSATESNYCNMISTSDSLDSAVERTHAASSVKLRSLIALSVIVIAVFQVSLFLAMQRFPAWKSDFASLYQAGRAIDHERFPSLVEHFPVLKSGEYTVETWAGELPSDTMHPPFEMVLYAALALLKFRIAVPFWWACNLLFLAITGFLLWPLVPNLRSKYPYLIILAGTFFPVLVALAQGQNSLLLLTLLTLCYHSLANKHDLRAGLILSMGMFKFVLVIPMVFLLILEKRWKSLAGFAVGCFGLFLVACSLLGIGGVTAYIRQIAGYGKAAPEKAGTELLMPNLRGLIHAFGSAIAPEVVLMVLTLILTLALVLWVDGRILKCSDLSARFSSQVLLAILISFHLYPHDGSILILPAVILLNHVLDRDIRVRFRRAVVLCVSLIYLVPLVAHLRISMPIIGLATLVLLGLEQSQFSPNRVPVAVH